MAKTVKAIVITGNGTNCEREVAVACQLAGAECDVVHLAELLAGRVSLDRYHFLNLAGGFLDGDDLGSAKAGANRFKHATVRNGQPGLAEQLQRFVAEGKLIMGVCNGFQLMVKLGLLPALSGPGLVQSVTLSHNDSGRFEDRWCSLRVDPQSPCIYTRGLDCLDLPVRHGEGKFFTDPQTLKQIETQRLVALRYVDAAGHPTMAYPHNPNGSLSAIGGICDRSGRLFGLMPHPEAYTHRVQHPRWTREKNLPEQGMGLWLYQNAVRFIAEELL